MDVEGDELNVLLGVGSMWPAIKQLIVEVHDIEGRLAAVRDVLIDKGYTVTIEQQVTEVHRTITTTPLKIPNTALHLLLFCCIILLNFIQN